MKKKICFVGHFLFNGSGASRITVSLCNNLSTKYDIYLLSICGKFNPPFYSIDNKVSSSTFNINPDKRLRNIVIPSFFKVMKYLKSNNIDTVFVVGVLFIPMFYLIKMFTKIKVVFCDHENIANRDKKSIFFRKIACKISDKIVVLTSRTMKDYIKIFGIDKNRIECIYNYIDDDIYKNSCKCDISSKKIISVGRISDEKGYDMAVDVAKIVFKKHSDWQWHVYGDGPSYEKINKKIKDYGLQDNFILKGSTNRINEKYKDYSIFVLPSYREGLPLVMLEAKCNNLPLVSFDCATGPSEIINDGVDGFLVECYNVEKMAQRICDLIEDTDLRKKFSENSKNNLHEFAKDNILRKWTSLIDNLD